MKKEYIKPEMVVEEILLESSMLITSIPEGNPDEGEWEPLSNKRRGSWGDLWTSED